jgi:hypothetical protein
MDPQEFYSPAMTNTADFFLLEYEAQPRTLVDPRETAVLAAPNPTTALSQAAGSGSQAVKAPVSAMVSPSLSAPDTSLILEKLEQQHNHMHMLTQLWATSAQSSIGTQIFTLRDLLTNARRELTNLLDIYASDASEVAEEVERVRSLERKLGDLEAEEGRLFSITGQAQNPPALK